jgi:hypothetical protein
MLYIERVLGPNFLGGGKIRCLTVTAEPGGGGRARSFLFTAWGLGDIFSQASFYFLYRGFGYGFEEVDIRVKYDDCDWFHCRLL